VSWRAGGDGKGIQIPAEVWERVFGPKSEAELLAHHFIGPKTSASVRHYQGTVTTTYDPPLTDKDVL